jgi:sodium pump decarboxylase gamma subunit
MGKNGVFQKNCQEIWYILSRKIAIPHIKNNKESHMNEPNLAFVCFMGIAVVFIGLVILIGLIYLMNFICDKVFKNKGASKSQNQQSTVVTQTNDVIPNREELVAAVCAAIAEEEGTDISAIRVLSIKKVN